MICGTRRHDLLRHCQPQAPVVGHNGHAKNPSKNCNTRLCMSTGTSTTVDELRQQTSTCNGGTSTVICTVTPSTCHWMQRACKRPCQGLQTTSLHEHRDVHNVDDLRQQTSTCNCGNSTVFCTVNTPSTSRWTQRACKQPCPGLQTTSLHEHRDVHNRR